MPDSAILRALVIPVALLAVFFTFARACSKSIMKTRAAEFAPATPAPGVAAAAPSKPKKNFGEIEYPPGLTEEQISYLVSVDTEFAEPMTATASKNGYDSGAETLRRIRYLESDENGGYRLSRDGIMKLRIAQETPESWTFFVTKRVFDRVSAVAMQPDGNARVTIAWHWEENDLMKFFGVRTSGWGAVAEFRSNDNAWTLYRWTSSLKSTY